MTEPELPEEIWIKCLSFLPLIPSFVTTSLVSKEWRRIIISTPTLYREIDLSSRGVYSPLHASKDLIGLGRLIILAQGIVFKISHDITWLFTDFENGWTPHGDSCIKDLLMFLQVCGNHLLELTLVVKDPRIWNKDREPAQVVPFLLIFINKLKSGFPQLKTIRISAPVDVSFKVGRDGVGFRQVYLVDNHRSLPISRLSFEQKELSVLMKEVKELAGDELTEFKGGQYESSEAPKVLDHLFQSRFNLQLLDISNGGTSSLQGLWHAILSCVNLTSLTLKLYAEPFEDLVLLLPDQTLRANRLKHFRFHFSGELEIDWVSFGRWLGGGIEDLSLFSFGTREQLGILPYDVFPSMVMQSQDTLKSLKLQRMEWKQDEFLVQTFDNHFPNLESLDINASHSGLDKFFSTGNLPKLHRLTIKSDTKGARNARCFLIEMLKVHDAKLTRLSYDVPDKVKFKPPSEHLSFSFPNLETLYIDPKSVYMAEYEEASCCADALGRWLSRFDFPRLKFFSHNWAYYDLFKARAPCLEDPGFRMDYSENGDRLKIYKDGTVESL